MTPAAAVFSVIIFAVAECLRKEGPELIFDFIRFWFLIFNYFFFGLDVKLI